MKSAQRGIAFSTFCAFLVSSLILIVGSGDYGNEIIDHEFEIADIADAVSKFFGTTGVVIYSLGFISAALSSMLTVCLGAALTADSLFSADKDQKIPNREVNGTDIARHSDRAIAVPSGHCHFSFLTSLKSTFGQNLRAEFYYIFQHWSNDMLAISRVKTVNRLTPSSSL